MEIIQNIKEVAELLVALLTIVKIIHELRK